MNFLYDFGEIEIRLPFYKFFSKFWNISGGLYGKVRSDCHLIEAIWVCCKIIQPQRKYKTLNFLRLLRHFHWKDCPDTFNETKNKLESATWSHYKHHNTADLFFVFFLILQ